MADERLPLVARLRLGVRIWTTFVRVWWSMRRRPVAVVVVALAAGPTTRVPAGRTLPPGRLAWAVHRALRAGSHRPRCLLASLVLYRLLHEQGTGAVVVIGRLPDAPDQRAHAWVEVDGRDVGPPPGRGRHLPLARYGRSGVTAPEPT